MGAGELLVVAGREVQELLAGQRPAVMDAVARAYLAYGRGLASPPDSTFLRFPGRDRERIIALPAYLGGDWEVAGLKWIASFPDNTRRGLDRASAALILNDLETGHPVAVLESSIISAWRTAASAAVAARAIHPGGPEVLGVVGCGLIAHETLLFLRAAFPGASRVAIYDLDRGAAERFARRTQAADPGLDSWEIAGSAADVLGAADVAVLATTAITPHVERIPAADRPRTVLHLSLRDLAPEALLDADNTADDARHVCQARTSVHLLAESLGHARFMRASLAEILSGAAPARDPARALSLFHPFGLGMLDLAVGSMVWHSARERGVGTSIPAFLPPPWREPA